MQMRLRSFLVPVDAALTLCSRIGRRRPDAPGQAGLVLGLMSRGRGKWCPANPFLGLDWLRCSRWRLRGSCSLKAPGDQLSVAEKPCRT